METEAKVIQFVSRPVTSKVIRVEHLNIAFGSNQVLNDFNLFLNAGETLAVLGKSGSGKSVLIKCIIGLLKPDSGHINVLQNDIAALSTDALDLLRVKLGFLFQSNALYDSMTVRQNLEFPLRRHWMNMEQEVVNDLVRDTLKNVGLEHAIDLMPAELSGGMCKRIALARTLILKPEIILYDEPTTGLDPVTGKEISELMIEIQEKYNTSSLIISHDMRCIRRTANRVAILMDGKCYAEGSYAELARSGDRNIHQFFE